MRKKLFFFFFFALIFASPSFAENKVFVLFGQSNMVGLSNSLSLPIELRTIPLNCEVHVNGQQLNSFLDCSNYGPEVTLAHELSSAYPTDHIVLIKLAVISTSLYSWIPTWTAAKAALTDNVEAGDLYNQLLWAVDLAIAGKTVVFKSLFMMQGERDARYAIAAQKYSKNLKAVVSALRADIADNVLIPFLLGVINPEDANKYPYAHQVIQAQMHLFRRLPRVYPVSTHGLSKLEDRLHYDDWGLQELGRRFAATYLSLRLAR